MILKAALLALALLTLTPNRPNAKTETETEVNEAAAQFDHWFTAHKDQGLITIIWRKDVHSPWTARIYKIVPDKDLILWEEEGYPRLMLGVVQVEHDFELYPQGYEGHYR